MPGEFVAPTDNGESIANLDWWDLFQDDQLDDLIRIALEENRDLGIALSRVQEARLTVTAVRANQFPFLDISAFGGSGRESREFVPGADSDDRFLLAGDLTYQVDLWGEFRRGTEAARADLMATEFAYRNVTITVVTEVARTYLLLRDLDARLEISRRTQKTRQEGLTLVQARFDKGTVPELDVLQARIQLSVAEAATASFERQVVQAENALQILLGRNPGPVIRGDALKSQGFVAPTFPPACPRNCCSGDRTWCAPKPNSWRQRPASAWQKRYAIPPCR